MSLYSEKIDNIIQSLQVNDVKENKEKKISVNLNSHSREFKNIQFRSQMYKNSQVKKQEKEIKVKEDKVKDYLDLDQTNIYNRPWNKLENGFKKNRISAFLEQETEDKNLSLKEKENLKNLLYNAVDNKEINKKDDVEYNCEEGYIEKIKSLEYDENTGYTLNIVKKKTKPKILKEKEINIISSLKKKTESNRKKREDEKKNLYKHLDNV